MIPHVQFSPLFLTVSCVCRRKDPCGRHREAGVSSRGKQWRWWRRSTALVRNTLDDFFACWDGYSSSGRNFGVSQLLRSSAACIDQKARWPFLRPSWQTSIEPPVIRKDNLLWRWWLAYSWVRPHGSAGKPQPSFQLVAMGEKTTVFGWSRDSPLYLTIWEFYKIDSNFWEIVG